MYSLRNALRQHQSRRRRRQRERWALVTAAARQRYNAALRWRHTFLLLGCDVVNESSFEFQVQPPA